VKDGDAKRKQGARINYSSATAVHSLPHEVTNDGTDRSQLSHVANQTKTALGVEKLDAVADPVRRGINDMPVCIYRRGGAARA
jgi:hypothetical protein